MTGRNLSKPQYWCLICTVSIYIFHLSQAHASTDYFDLTPEQLINIKVASASKKTESIAQAPAAVYVITNEDIIRSGVTNIPDALRMVPGVQVAQSDSNSWAISIRGFNSVLANKLLVLIDGRTIYNPVFGGVLWEAQDLILEDIERIEVIRGPGGTLWGANAVNGVINIITKNSKETQGNLVSALYGNEEKGTLTARHGGKFGNSGSYRIYAKNFDRDSSQTPDGGDTYDSWGGYKSGFRADWDDNFTLQGDIYRTETEQRKINYSLIVPYATLENQTLKYEGANILGRWIDKKDDGSQLSIQSYIDWARRDEPFNFVDNRAIYDLETQYNFKPLGRNEITIGAGYRFSSSNEEGNNNVSFSPKRYNDSLYNAFLQDKIMLLPETWFLTLGSKLEHNDYSGFEVQPNARLQWHPDKQQSFWASISRAVRTPTPIEENLTSTIATASPGIRLAFVPNEDFKSEKLTAYELGYRNQLTSTLSIDATVFYNVYDQLETFSLLPPFLVNNGVDPLHFFLPVQFQNDMKGKSHGFEIASSWNVDENLKIIANYSALILSVDAGDNSQEGAEDNYPSQQVSLRTSWNINEEWTLDTTLNYVDQLKENDIDNYFRVDANLGWKISPNIRLNIVGQNLFDSAHREFGEVNDPNAGEVQRSIFGKLTWGF